MLLIYIVSKFHNNFILKTGKKSIAPGSVEKIVQTVGPDGLLFTVSAHGYTKWIRKTNKT